MQINYARPNISCDCGITSSVTLNNNKFFRIKSEIAKKKAKYPESGK